MRLKVETAVSVSIHENLKVKIILPREDSQKWKKKASAGDRAATAAIRRRPTGGAANHPARRGMSFFSPPWPNLLGSETNMAAIQDRDRAGHHTFMPMKVMLFFGWMVGDDAAAIEQCWDHFDELVLIALGQQQSEK